MATIRQRGKSWQLTWEEGGRQRRKSLGKVTAEQAETCRLAKEFELQTGKRIFVAADLFGDFVRDYLDWHAAKFPDSHFRVKQICEQCFGDFLGRSLADISTQDIERWLAQRETRVGHNRRRLDDLLKQATTERSHFYVASCCRDAIAEIRRLREYEWMYKDLCK